MIDFEVEIPSGLDLVLSEARLETAVARKIATAVRRRFRRAKGAKGALPPAKDKDAKRPLRRTGELIRSIKSRKAKRKPKGGGRRGRVVFATGKRDDGIRNAQVLAIQMHKRKTVEAADPMGIDTEVRRVASAAADKELRRQVARAEARIEAQGVRAYRAGRERAQARAQARARARARRRST